MILVVCPWCKKVVRERASKKQESSYEICAQCKTEALEKVKTVDVCPHGEPITAYCLGCEATVGGNTGA